jgi:hypothetical protein
MRIKFLMAVLVIGIVLPQMNDCSAADASFRTASDHLVIQSPRWAMALDARTGAIRRIDDRTASGTLLRGDINLWGIERHDLPEIEASASEMEYKWHAEKGELTLAFDGPDAAVNVVCVAAPEGPAWQAEVRMKRGTMVGWRFPNGLEFDAEGLHQFVLPENLGLAFTTSFFQPGGAGVQRHTLGGNGLQQVAADRCRMRPVPDQPVAVKPGKDAPGWMPDWYVREMTRWRVTANRCPAGDTHELSLVEAEHGCWLSAYRLGGWGWLFRFGGMLSDEDTRPQVASVIATLAHLHRRPAEDGVDVSVPQAWSGKAPAEWPKPPHRIGVLLPRPTARPGVRLRPDPAPLLTELARQRWVKEAGIRIVVLRDVDDVRAALADPREWFAIVNTIKEGFPAAAADGAEGMLRAIRDYVRNGGIWWEAGGGYSFFHAIVPRRNAKFSTANRDFCDFAAVDSETGRWSLYGIQRPDDIYTPARAEIASAGPPTARVGRYTHTFLAFARPGDTVRLPRQQMVLGKPHREVLGEYGRQNGFIRGLAQKASPDVIEKLKRCILLKVTTRDLKQSARIAEDLPQPVLFHIADYLRGGFDKQYPDHLPPNLEVGTPDDLSALVQACRKNGHLFMPYTNPTWWCVNPKGPTFEKVGDAPLSRDLNGKVYPESYGESQIQGYTVCAWHPAVRAANDKIRRQFTQQYPVDVLFQDQVGARGPRWDTNPASPHPGAYLEGIHRIARVDSAFVPLGTEDGHGRLINHETMFCGLSWPWLPNRPSHSRVLYEDLWPRGAWRIEPLALFLAHDKVLFYHHDLGGFVRNRRDLSITLVMGYGLSWWTHTANPSSTERDWIERLCRMQAAIGPRCAGRRLDEFEHLAPEVLRSRWGDLEVIANLTPKPWTVDAQTVLAPEGFLARAPDLQAGICVRHAGQDLGPHGSWLIREKQHERWSEWSAETEPGR